MNLVGVFSALTEIPLRYQEKADALKRIAELGKEALGSDACSLIFVNLAERYMTQAACAGFDEEFWNRLNDKKIPLGPTKEGYWVDYDLLAKGEPIELYDLSTDGGGAANPHTARRYNLQQVLSYPLKSDGKLIGYFSHFSTSSKAFTEEQKRWVEVFARQAVVAIERFEQQQTMVRSLKIINELCRSPGQIATSDFMRQVSKQACDLLSVPVCIVWKPDRAGKKLQLIAATGDVDDDYRQIQLDLNHAAIQQRLQSKQASSLSDVRRTNHELLHREEVVRRGWVSLMTAPMYVGERLIGMLDVYTYELRIFKAQEKELFSVFANQAAMFVQKAELLRETEAWHEKYVILSGSSETPPGRLRPDSELSETLYLIVKACAETRAAIKTCSFWLWNRATDRLEIQTIYDKSGRKWDLSSIPRYRRGEGICQRVIDADKCCICRNQMEGGCFTGFEIGRSALCVPIRSGGAIIGAVCLGSDELDTFADEDKLLMENIVQAVPVAIQRASVRDGELRLARLTGTSKSLDSLLKELVRITCDLIREPVCLLWLLDKDRGVFIVKASVVPEGQEETCKGLSIPFDGIGTRTFLRRNRPLYIGRPGRRHPSHPFSGQMDSLGWGPMLAMPLNFEDETVGILTVFSYRTRRRFEKWPRRLFSTLATQAASAITDHISHHKLHILSRTLREMTDAGDEQELMIVALKRSLELVGSSKGWISRLDLSTGTLDVATQQGGPSGRHAALKIGEGVTGKSLLDHEPQRAADVRMPEWKDIYKEYWKDTHSELAVPILIRDVRVRVGKSVQRGSKPLGVLNVESPTIGAFSKLDEDCLCAVADGVAVILDKLESDLKLQQLRDVEARIIRKSEWRGVFEVLMSAVRDVLGFHYVNVSLVDNTNQIRTEFFSGISEAQVAKFKTMAVHPLEGVPRKDIQADIVNSRNIEVLDKYDPRCDQRIFEEFGHEKLIRVFMPIVVPLEDRVIGTVETGYDKGYRKFMYERDVQILKGLVEYAAVALQQRRRGLFQRTMHELRNPTIGIRNHALVLTKRFSVMKPELVTKKLDDIITDCGTLLFQIAELEHFLGGSPPASGIEKTLVFRDVIIKIINQLKREVIERRFDTRKVHYESTDIGKLNLYLDKAKLSQVVYNVLINSIKYAEKDPSSFAIRIAVDEDENEFVVKFKDWGIGIKKEFQNRIFDEGFRAEDAMQMSPMGSGLGLTISREIMRAMGGDLRLANAYKPTELHLVLPKLLKENPSDSLPR